MSSSIEVQNLQFSYFEDGKNTLDGISASFSKEDITVLLGKSGCGKSTLLYVIAGLYPHNAGILKAGEALVDGQALRNLEPKARCRIAGMMFQNPDLQFCMDTVRNEMIFCLENTGEEPSHFEERMDKALAFCGIEDLKYRSLQTLSGGEKQRVALACVVLQKPSWLLLDEPFANVDDRSAHEILLKLKELHETFHIGILAVDHRPENWSGIADSLQLFEDGQIQPLKDGIPGRDPVFSRSSKDVLSDENGHIKNGDRPVVLALEDVSVRHEKHQAPYLSHISCAFQKGKSYAVVGESGCGKSTLFGAIEGLYPYGGKILLNGVELRKYRRKSFGQIGFVTQNPQDQFIGGSVKHEVLTALRKVPDAETKCKEILKSIHLWKYRDVSPYMLSQGQQRRLGVAVLMAYPCEVLICDEPTYAQDPENTAVIMNYLLEQVEKHGVTLIFSTHDPAVAKAYADEIYSFRKGTLEAASLS